MKTVIKLVSLGILLFLGPTGTVAHAKQRCHGYLHQLSYPQAPDPHLTPGSLCNKPDSYRYPEMIAYCRRNVNTWTKTQVLRDYNRLRGFKIHKNHRSKFKVDHLIPICMGGSNEMDNLWPQHESLYKITDELDRIACEKMAEGRLTQKRAVELVLRAKNNLSEAPQIERELKAL